MILLHLDKLFSYLCTYTAIFCATPASRLDPFSITRFLGDYFRKACFSKGGKVAFAYALPGMIADNIARTGPIAISSRTKLVEVIDLYAKLLRYLSWQTTIIYYTLTPLWLLFFAYIVYRHLQRVSREFEIQGIDIRDLLHIPHLRRSQQEFVYRIMRHTVWSIMCVFNASAERLALPLALMFLVNRYAPSILILTEQIRILSGATRASTGRSAKIVKEIICLGTIAFTQSVTAITLLFLVACNVLVQIRYRMQERGDNMRQRAVVCLQAVYARILYNTGVVILALVGAVVWSTHGVVGSVYLFKTVRAIVKSPTTTEDLTGLFLRYVKY